MDLGYGFCSGSNNVTKQKVENWLHTDLEINWNAFVWYITQYIDVEKYSSDSIDVKIASKKQREHFYKSVIKYDDEIWSHNYNIDKNNEQHKTQYSGYRRNKSIIESLVNEIY